MFSCVGPTGQLRDNCRELVSIVYEKSRSSQMAQEDARIEAAQVADYRRVLQQCSETCSHDFFYDRFAKSSLPYGKVFRAVKNCHSGFGKTCYEVKVVEVDETFTKGKLERPFLIHSATLDAVFKAGWGVPARTQSRLRLRQAHVAIDHR